MADLKEFLSLLESTVKAPRLSGSKVSLLSTQSKKLEPKSDTEFISTFLRLNKSLGKKSTSRISSLYVFDAIARANKGISGREGLMMKMEGVVDSWVNEMCEDGKGGVWTEGRDKTRKIVDIWTKSSTFPQPCLDRLSARLAVASADHSTTPTMSPPRPIMSPALPPLEEKENRGLGAHGFGQGPVLCLPSVLSSCLRGMLHRSCRVLKVNPILFIAIRVENTSLAILLTVQTHKTEGRRKRL
ncbi:hypothetical protein BD324DRAFT_437929 [Kockovaella imperatae]|uniref:CID domain-containing protein n=1 Tax=Kockovaella imperatae TaxID=4999 RepID=A0A1Y1UGT4_9TREE|nr:hypothetical protein BD324DRAFT_437929 [Kockovaella imperatae]ORX37270.1 hypothetical protein BD324DRAFT_437929 [Kockovaella imperatae]